MNFMWDCMMNTAMVIFGGFLWCVLAFAVLYLIGLVWRWVDRDGYQFFMD